MKSRLFTIIMVLSIVISSLISATAFQIKESNIDTADLDIAYLPIWNIGNYWKYNMDMLFIYNNEDGKKVLKIDAEITNMYANLTEIITINNEDIYKLKLDGKITGTVDFLFLEDVAQLNGHFGGYAYIAMESLGIKEFEFNVDGEVFTGIRWRDLNFDMNMNFIPCFNFFEFPIKSDDEPWDMYIEEANLTASVFIDVLGGKYMEFSNSTAFDDIISLDRIETIILPNSQTFETFVLSGTWGDPSYLWYAPEAGYLIKVDETLDWDNGSIISNFYLELIDTNYNEGNSPPNKPNIPIGEDIGQTDQEYTYSTFSTDPEEDQIYYLFDWGDNTNSGWLGPFDSGIPCNAVHSWPKKGMYNIMVKAKDIDEIESEWSDPLSVTITGQSHVFLTINHIEGKDELDVGSEPEWYYSVVLIDELGQTEERVEYNKDNGNWITDNVWSPEILHEFKASSRNMTIQIKLMDYDSIFELGSDDLADISGSDIPDCNGRDNSVDFKRGAVYHGTYNVINSKLKDYSPDPNENADMVEEIISDINYLTSGDLSPDDSTEFEGGIIPYPENDAIVIFTIETDYEKPQVNIKTTNLPENIRPTDNIEFRGTVIGGNPDYSWYWDFGDGKTSNIQNPNHCYAQDGTYTVILTLTDSFGETSVSSTQIIVNKNQAPIDLIIEGPGKGNINEKYDFKFKATDIDGDYLNYFIEWGDGTDTGWLGPYLSDTIITKSHQWTSKNVYTVTFTVKDKYGDTNSKTHRVSMPRIYDNNFLLRLLQQLYIKYPFFRFIF